jgi:hypothetical protein
MDRQGQTVTANGQSSDFQQTADEMRKLFADAPPFAKTALENVLQDAQYMPPAKEESATPLETAGRIGSRRGKVSELTVIAPLRPGGAKRLRAFLEKLHGTIGNKGVDKVGTVHDMRFVLLDNDTKMLFATAYDGDWDPYIDDFATKIPDILDLQFGEWEGWPGIHDPEVKDWIVKHQVQADFWYVANPDLTVVETRKLERVGKAVDEFLDQVSE